MTKQQLGLVLNGDPFIGRIRKPGKLFWSPPMNMWVIKHTTNCKYVKVSYLEGDFWFSRRQVQVLGQLQ